MTVIQQYDRCLNDLQKIHRNYDLGDEQIIADTAKIREGKFRYRGNVL